MTSLISKSSNLGMGFSFPIITALLIGLRFYVRKLRGAPKMADDWLTIPAWICVVGVCASVITGVEKGYFVEQDTDEADPGSVPWQQKGLAQITGAIQIFWIGSDTCIKLSILFFYRRIFRGKAFSIANYTCMALAGLWALYGFLAWILYCGTNVKANFEGGWDACPEWGSQMQTGVYILDLIVDFYVLVLPIPFVWKLHQTTQKRLGLIFVFLVGAFAFVASLNNTVIQTLDSLELVDTLTIEGVTGEYLQGLDLYFFDWQVLEVGVGLIACNLPTLSLFWSQKLTEYAKMGWSRSKDGVHVIFSKLSSRKGHAGSLGAVTDSRNWPSDHSGVTESGKGPSTKISSRSGSGSEPIPTVSLGPAFGDQNATIRSLEQPGAGHGRWSGAWDAV